MRLMGNVVLIMALAIGAAAQDAPSQLYDKALNALSGAGVNRNPLTAVEYLQSAAGKGHVPSQLALGYLYDTGSYVARIPSQAADWYRKAAEQGNQLGAWALGRQYLTGLGVSRDLRIAERWLKPAAEKGDPFAQLLLGQALWENDPTAAVPWFRKAAEQGLPQAQYRLALAYDEGRGVIRDRSEAYIWVVLSSESSRGTVEAKLSELESALGSTKIEALKNRVRAMEKTVSRSVNAHGCTGWDGEFNELPTVPPLELQKFCQ
jgi:uncharacterized protein